MNNLRVSFLVFFLLLGFLIGLFVRDVIKQESPKSGYPVAGEFAPPIDDAAVDVADKVEERTYEFRIVETKEALTIDWIDPKEQPVVAFDQNLYKLFCPETLIDNGTGVGMETYTNCDEPPAPIARQLGTVKGGTYDGRHLEMATYSQPGLGTVHTSVYYLTDPTKIAQPVIVDQYGVSTMDWVFGGTERTSARQIVEWAANGEPMTPEATFDTGLTIPDLTFDKTVEDTKGNLYHFRGYWVRYDYESISKLLASTETVALKDGRTLLRYKPTDDSTEPVNGSDAFLMIDEDGRALGYDLDVPFFTYGSEYERGSLIRGTPQITWTDGSKNGKEYLKAKFGGCGYLDTTHVVPASVVATLPELKQVGVAKGRDGSKTPILEPVTYDHVYYREALNIVTYDDAYEDPNPDAKEYSDFVHSYLYFKDAFGRMVELVSNELVPPVECGKPVIYLYPEETTDLTVEVEPRGGFSFTEPQYNDGWRVTAYPDGHLVNRDDGLTYPYLFWEGRGAAYASPTRYWVIERDRVEPFLRETLASMNLNEQEINDFVEFWLPRMQDAAYYRIGFHGTQAMDLIAPLNLSVDADHTFRVLMDYEPLSEIEPSNPPTRLPRANREGFEVIEWGGVLR